MNKEYQKVEIVCTPSVENNKLCDTKYNLKISSSKFEVIIPINKNITSLPIEDIISRILDVLNVNKTEVKTIEYNPTMPVIIPTPVKDPNNISDPWKDPFKPNVIWTSENIEK